MPYVALNPAVSWEKNLSTKDWLGEVKKQDIGEWVDGWLLLIFGGIPWQVNQSYFFIIYINFFYVPFTKKIVS